MRVDSQYRSNNSSAMLPGITPAGLRTLFEQLGNVKQKQALLPAVEDMLQAICSVAAHSISITGDAGDTHTLYVAAGAPLPDTTHQLLQADFAVQDGVFDQLLQANAPVVYDLETTVAMPVYMRLWQEQALRQVIGVPLKGVGVWWLLPDHKEAITPAQLEAIQFIAYPLTAAVKTMLARETITQREQEKDNLMQLIQQREWELNLQLEQITQYRQQLEAENLYLQEQMKTSYHYNELVGTSEQMQQVYRKIAMVASSSSTVLLLGETGTGKELIARAIHNSSNRKDKLMIKVNCAALPANLIESELFGHEKGSFTGAVERRIGKFELANNSTIFLDEIGEMPLELQVKLLRAIQEREIERIGGKGPISTDVRIIAATNRDLEKEAAAGRFRTDLFYRLNVFPIVLPPLRERTEDIALLASHFTQKFAHTAGKKIDGISANAVKELLHYRWPGNVRELEHFIERSVLLTEGSVVDKIHLPVSERIIAATRIAENVEDIKTIDEVERDYIIQVLDKCKGRIRGANGAAAMLKLPPTTLHSKIKKLGIRKGHG